MAKTVFVSTDDDDDNEETNVEGDVEKNDDTKSVTSESSVELKDSEIRKPTLS